MLGSRPIRSCGGIHAGHQAFRHLVSFAIGPRTLGMVAVPGNPPVATHSSHVSIAEFQIHCLLVFQHAASWGRHVGCVQLPRLSRPLRLVLGAASGG